MDADAAPVVVGRYALFDRIAVGGMASVHLARQLGPIGFSRVVAVKRLHSQYVHDDAFVEMFVDEARLASRLRHPSVVSVTDVIETGEELLLVMDYVHGVPVSSLREAIARGAIPLPVVSSIVVDVLDGLQAAHDACDEAGQPLRIVHRDISPHNVLVGVDGIARIIDFGIAKATDRVQTTRDGQIKGKIRYMAPEQLSGDEVDARSDVYSAAVMLWELLSGRALVSQDDMGAMVRRVLFESLPRPRHPTERLSAELVAVTMRGLERAPDDRYATAAEMARALREAVEPAPREEVGAWLGEAASGTLEEHRSLLRRVELAPLPDSDTSGLSGALRRVVDRQLRAEEVTEVEALAEAA
ncbi:MAG: serine/threonine protein kinase, partial [Myxococcales bacterium]|nr:serine/threonine protein kinase [Myxococcales bacterium]